MPIKTNRCEACRQPLRSRRATRFCSPACRTMAWRRARTRAITAAITQLQLENVAFRQRVGELEHLVGQLKTQRWTRR
jgi:hypothetical protein